tara:strand:+ start:41 stop:1027 length:987 start_codon:yes stop_codon:yes gene_type:complete
VKKKRVIKKIKIEDVVADTVQPRQDWDGNQNKLDSLLKDIDDNGLLYPIIVSPFYINGDNELVLGEDVLYHEERKWWILDGERRIRCHLQLDLDEIDAIIRTDLTMLEMMKIQFISNTKRLAITITEMSKAIKRYRDEYSKENKDYEESDLIDSLCELTGYSPIYFDSAEAINRADNDMRMKVLAEDIGGYAPREIEKATKNENFRRGLTDAYVNSKKPISALAPRALRYDLKVAEEETNLKPKEERLLSCQMMLDFINQNSGEMDKESNYLLYRQKAMKFSKEIRRWNLKGLDKKEIGSLVSVFEDIYNYFKEERRLNNQIFKSYKK